MNYVWVVLCLLATLLVACNEATPETPKTVIEEFKLSANGANLYHIVGEKHDTAMLLMKNIEQTRSALRLEMKKMESGTEKDTILDLLTALKKADDGMMNWMHEFKSTALNEEEYKAMSEEAIITYLKREESKIEKVHVDMLESIENGQAFLDK